MTKAQFPDQGRPDSESLEDKRESAGEKIFPDAEELAR